MKLNRKISIGICALVIILSFVGCSSKSHVIDTIAKPVVQKMVSQPKQAELDAKVKEEAVIADFVEINGHERENIGRAYFIEGEVTNIDSTDEVLPLFTATVKEGTGYARYDVLNFQKVDVNVKDKVKVYGELSGEKNSKGMIQISGNVIEKK